MSDLNTCIFSGRLTEDPQEFTANGDTACRFSIASNRVWKEGERASYFPVVVFGPQAKTVLEYMHKGSHVSVEARYETDTYTDKEGNKRKGHSFVARQVNFLGTANKANTEAEMEIPSSPPTPPRPVRVTRRG